MQPTMTILALEPERRERDRAIRYRWLALEGAGEDRSERFYLELDVSYHAGRVKRYSASFRVVSEERRPGSPFTSTSYALFSDVRVWASEPVARYNARRLAEAAPVALEALRAAEESAEVQAIIDRALAGKLT